MWLSVQVVSFLTWTWITSLRHTSHSSPGELSSPPNNYLQRQWYHEGWSLEWESSKIDSVKRHLTGTILCYPNYLCLCALCPPFAADHGPLPQKDCLQSCPHPDSLQGPLLLLKIQVDTKHHHQLPGLAPNLRNRMESDLILIMTVTHSMRVKQITVTKENKTAVARPTSFPSHLESPVDRNQVVTNLKPLLDGMKQRLRQ